MPFLDILTAELNHHRIPFTMTAHTLDVPAAHETGFGVRLEIDPAGPDYIVTYGARDRDYCWRAHFLRNAEMAYGLLRRGLSGDVRLQVITRGKRITQCIVEREVDGAWLNIGHTRATFAPPWLPEHSAVLRNAFPLLRDIDLAHLGDAWHLNQQPLIVDEEELASPAARRRAIFSALFMAAIGVLLAVGGWASGPAGHWLQWGKAGLGVGIVLISLLRYLKAQN
jgi:hypothetical protein